MYQPSPREFQTDAEPLALADFSAGPEAPSAFPLSQRPLLRLFLCAIAAFCLVLGLGVAAIAVNITGGFWHGPKHIHAAERAPIESPWHNLRASGREVPQVGLAFASDYHQQAADWPEMEGATSSAWNDDANMSLAGGAIVQVNAADVRTLRSIALGGAPLGRGDNSTRSNGDQYAGLY